MEALQFALPPDHRPWGDSLYGSLKSHDGNIVKDFRGFVLPMRDFLDDLRLGILELRNPEEHLHLLLQNKLIIDGWPFSISEPTSPNPYNPNPITSKNMDGVYPFLPAESRADTCVSLALF